jgi:hypothetical protein
MIAAIASSHHFSWARLAAALEMQTRRALRLV